MAVMAENVNIVGKSRASPATAPGLSITLSGPMRVQSSLPKCGTWHRASIVGVTVAYGFIAMGFPIGIRRPVDSDKLAEIEFVEVSNPEPAAVEPEAPPTLQAADTPTADPVVPEALPEEPVPSGAPADPETAPPSQAPERQVTAEPPPLAKPSDQPIAMTEVEPPQPAPAKPLPPSAKTVTPRPSRPQPHVTALHSAAPETKTQTAPTVSGNVNDNRAETRTLTSLIRDAVQAAVQCPKAARMMDQSGKTGVAFDFRDGVVAGSVQLARSSGLTVLDAAALAAVRNAHYPDAPPGALNQVMHLLIWVEEACGS